MFLRAVQNHVTHLIWIKMTQECITFFEQPPCVCVAVQIDAIGDKPLRDVVRDLGGWPVSERDWVEPEWPLEHLLGQLRGDYNQGVIIEQWVGPDDKNSSMNVIQVSACGISESRSLGTFRSKVGSTIP